MCDFSDLFCAVSRDSSKLHVIFESDFFICVCLKQRELELQQMKEREDETEMERDERPLPSMQSCGTQTEQVV